MTAYWKYERDFHVQMSPEPGTDMELRPRIQATGESDNRFGRTRKFLQREHGLTVTEYAVAAGLIAATLAGTLQVLGTTIDGMITTLLAFM